MHSHGESVIHAHAMPSAGQSRISTMVSTLLDGVAEEPSEDVDEPPPKKRRLPPKRGDKWEALFAV